MEVYIDFPMELIHKRKLKLALAVVSTVACVNIPAPCVDPVTKWQLDQGLLCPQPKTVGIGASSPVTLSVGDSGLN